MNESETKQSEEAVAFLKSRKDEFLLRFADPKQYTSDTSLISVFMAGSPGAGKTEVSRALLEVIGFQQPPVIIDADEIRTFFPEYNGKNSYIFQTAATLGVNYLYKHALENQFNLVLDTTFSYKGAMENVERSLNRNRRVIIDFIFQDPLLAWTVVKARERKEGRMVPRERFIEAFFECQRNVNFVMERFGTAVELNVIIKNADFVSQAEYLNTNSLDEKLPKHYTHDELELLLPHD